MTMRQIHGGLGLPRPDATLDTGNPQASVYWAMAKRLASDPGFQACLDAEQPYGGYDSISRITLWKGGCAACVSTRFWKVPTKSCALSWRAES